MPAANPTNPSTVVFDDFSGGDYGRNWAGMTPDPADAKFFRGVNVITYPGGWVGPRQPLKRFTLPAVGGQRSLPAKSLWFVENEILLMSDGSAWNVETGECNNVGTDPDRANVTKLVDFSVSQKQSGEMFCISYDSATQVSFTIALHNGSLGNTKPTFVDRVTGGDTPMPNGLRIGNHEDSDVLAAWRNFYWANLNQAQVWDPADFNFVGRVIYDLVDQKNTLVILIGSRDSNAISVSLDTATRGRFVPGVHAFVVYGTLSGDATFRRVDSGPAPAATDSGAFIWSVQGDDVWWFNNDRLMNFDGSAVTVQFAPLPRIIHNPANYAYGPTATVPFWCENPGLRQEEFILAGSLGSNGGVGTADPSPTLRRGVFNWFGGYVQTGAVLHQYISRNAPVVWTAHDPGIEFHADPYVNSAGAAMPGAAQSSRGDGNFFVYRRREDAMVFVTQGSTAAAEAPKFYEMDLLANFPDAEHNDGDTGAPVSADFYTADYWDALGREIYVKSVSIDYAYTQPTDLSTLPTKQTFTAEVEMLQLYNDHRPRPSGAITFVPPAVAGDTSDGDNIIRGRTRLPLRSQGSGNGFRIHLSNWRGMTVRRITAEITFDPAR